MGANRFFVRSCTPDRVNADVTIDADQRAGNMADPAVAREGQQKRTASRRYTTSSEFVCQCRKSRAFDGHGLAKGVHLKETVVIDNLAQFR